MELSSVDTRTSETRSQVCDRLLDVAEKLFAERGFRATSVRDITAEAGCNVAAVNYYFGGKDNLYREMFRRRLAALRDQRIASIERGLTEFAKPDASQPRAQQVAQLETEQPFTRPASLEGLLRAFTTAFLEPLLRDSRNPSSFQLFSRELVDPHLPPQILLNEMVEPVEEAWTRAARAACPGLDENAARLCLQSVVGQLVHVIQIRKLLGSCRGEEECSLEGIVEHVVRFSAAGVRACVGEREVSR